MTPGEVLIQAPVPQDWSGIAGLRGAVLEPLWAAFPQATDYCDLLWMIVRELCENAIKYGDRARGEIAGAFQLTVEGTAEAIAIAVTSTPSDPRDAARCLALVAQIASAPNAQEAYLERLREVALEEKIGGLGLARIAYESNGRLSATLEDGGVLKVKVVTRPVEFAELRFGGG